jgi:hypothetical protein
MVRTRQTARAEEGKGGGGSRRWHAVLYRDGDHPFPDAAAVVEVVEEVKVGAEAKVGAKATMEAGEVKTRVHVRIVEKEEVSSRTNTRTARDTVRRSMAEPMAMVALMVALKATKAAQAARVGVV